MRLTKVFKVTALPALDKIIVDLSAQFVPMQTQISDQLDDFKKMVTEYIDIGYKYESMTSLYRILAVAVYGIPIVFALLGLATRSPRIMKGYFLLTQGKLLLHTILFLTSHSCNHFLVNDLFDWRRLYVCV
jgi:hypothetical protein